MRINVWIYLRIYEGIYIKQIYERTEMNNWPHKHTNNNSNGKFPLVSKILAIDPNCNITLTPLPDTNTKYKYQEFAVQGLKNS